MSVYHFSWPQEPRWPRLVFWCHDCWEHPRVQSAHTLRSAAEDPVLRTSERGLYGATPFDVNQLRCNGKDPRRHLQQHPDPWRHRSLASFCIKKRVVLHHSRPDSKRYRWYEFRSWFVIAGRESFYLCGSIAKATVADGPLTHRIGQAMNWINSDQSIDPLRITIDGSTYPMWLHMEMNDVIRLVQVQRIYGFWYCVMELKLLEATDQIRILRLQLSIGLTARCGPICTDNFTSERQLTTVNCLSLPHYGWLFSASKKHVKNW